MPKLDNELSIVPSIQVRDSTKTEAGMDELIRLCLTLPKFTDGGEGIYNRVDYLDNIKAHARRLEGIIRLEQAGNNTIRRRELNG